MHTATVGSSFPIRFLPNESFQQLRQAMDRAGYSGIPITVDLHLGKSGASDVDIQLDYEGLPDSARLMADLFLTGRSKPRTAITDLIGTETLDLLLSFGLLVWDPLSERVFATVAMYPTFDLMIVSDRWSGVDGAPLQMPSDFVFPAILGSTRSFLNMIPASPCERFLDVCGGTGIAALLAATRGAQRACIVEISDRSAHFAEFNRRLNGIENVTVLQGDLYGPTNRATFDRIVAHPPYLPALEPQRVFYDGGQDGEQITRRLIQDLPAILEEKGLFVCVASGSDRKGQPFEERVRQFLGSDHEQFDVAVFLRRDLEPTIKVLNDVVRGRAPVEQVQLWHDLFAKLEVERFVFGGIYIRRHGRQRKGYTTRFVMGRSAGLPEIGAALDWQHAVADGRSPDLLRNAVLRSRADCRVEANYVLKSGKWALDHQRIVIEEPFSMQLEAPRWIVGLLEVCDGSCNGEQAFQLLKEEDSIPSEFTFLEFADVLRVLVSGGFVAMTN